MLDVVEVLVVLDSTTEVAVLDVSTDVVDVCPWIHIQLKWNIFRRPTVLVRDSHRERNGPM